MHRLFVGLPLPAPVRDACLAASASCPPGWARQGEDQLHLTLRFVGEVDRHRAEDVADALGHLSLPALAMALAGVGHFDHGHRGSLFARVVPRDPLEALHRRVDRALTSVGLAPERRAYFPHVTLARARTGAEPPQRWIEANAGLSVGPTPVQRMILFESHLGREGASYEAIEAYRLPVAGGME